MKFLFLIVSIFFLNLAQVEDVDLIDKRGYLTISLTVAKEGKILLRKPEGIREWHQALKVRNLRKKKKTLVQLCGSLI